jgi:hypothetical protein
MLVQSHFITNRGWVGRAKDEEGAIRLNALFSGCHMGLNGGMISE